TFALRVRAMSLDGVAVLVAGAGLSGVAAAHDLIAMGADVTGVGARDRVGGRVWAIRDAFAERQHAETGGDLVDDDQDAFRARAGELKLKLTRILRGSFGATRRDEKGRPQLAVRGITRGWERLGKELAPAGRPYQLAERRWDTPIAASLARRSVAN